LKKLVDINPLVPSDIWLAIGICYFKLNNLVKAKFSLEYVLEIDPENSMALTSLGITELYLNPSDPTQREKAVLLFQKSFEIDDTNPLTMKHLADHFFFANDLDIS
jgi:RNA polymerase-associated protein CTR9